MGSLTIGSFSCVDRRCVSLAPSKHVVRRLLRFVGRTGADCRLRHLALAGLLVVGAAANTAAQPVRQVLVLQSVNRGNRVIDEFTGSFRVELDRRVENPVNVIQVVVGPVGFGRASEHAVVEYIRSGFTDGPKPDLIMTVGGPAAIFARTHRQQLFPDTPLLLGAVDRRYLGDAPLGDNDTAVPVDNEFSGVVDGILRLLPQTRQVFMVLGSGQIGQFWHRQLEEQFRRFHDRLAFVWWDDLSLPEILRRSATLPDKSAIYYVTFGTDAAGAAYADDRVVADLHAAANAPLFAAHSVYLGAGIVGGPLLPIEDLSRDTAEVASRLLNGTPPRSMTFTARAPGLAMYDWRELRRWGIPESRLAAGSVVRYRPPSLWSTYKGTVLSAAGALAVQSLLIVALLYQRRARQRAELASRKNLAFAADVSRRQTMSALASSIAHELVQPLSAIIHNAKAGLMMITANRATPDAVGEILSDIESDGAQATQIIDRHRAMLRGRRLDTRPTDLHVVLQDSLALVAHDMRARQIEANLDFSASPCIITGDPVLLQQVLVNLTMNALDAMADTPPERRRLSISTDVRAADVAVSVRDTGTGLPPEINGTLFTPFVTTKPHGLGIGLTIVQMIVEAHGGRVSAHNNPDGGATFTVTLRRSETPRGL